MAQQHFTVSCTLELLLGGKKIITCCISQFIIYHCCQNYDISHSKIQHIHFVLTTLMTTIATLENEELSPKRYTERCYNLDPKRNSISKYQPKHLRKRGNCEDSVPYRTKIL